MQTQNTFGNYAYLLLIIGFLCLNTTLQAQVQDLFSDPILGPQLAIGAQTELIDPMCSDPAACGNFVNCETRSYVELRMDPLTDPSINYDAGVYQITVGFSVEYIPNDNSGNPSVTEPHTLTVEFNKDGGTFVNKDWVLLDGGYDIEVIITSVTLNPPNDPIITNPTPAQLPVEAFLRIGSKRNRFLPLAQTTTVNVDVDYAQGSSTASPFFIEFDWNEIPGAESYDLEWTWLDSETTLPNGNPSTELDFNFKFNSTRINTTMSDYEIPNAYRKGVLIARVRGVGKIDDCDLYVQSDWSVAEEGTVMLDAAGLPTCSFCFAVEPHREKINWQHTRTYAEEGKHKDVISYFDGSLRSRQTVTRIESDDHAIVAESYYDHVGRTVASALPVPAINGNGYDRRIDFYDNFNQTDDGANGLQPFNRQAFETTVDGEDCNVSTPEMSSTSGSSQYFSPQNPIQDDHQAYVPNADGFPYTQTIYTQDNTGRIRVQGGVGPDHKLGEHDTKFFYGIPEQQELDRLFGNNVGYHQYYKKNMVVDANNQVSISYLDNKQRVIATALAGDSVAALLALPSFHDVENQNQIISYLHELNEPSDQVDRNSQLTINKSLLVSEEGSYMYDYELVPQDFMDACAPDICFDCAYEVKMMIYDDCNQLVDTREVKSIVDLNNNPVDGACDETTTPLTFNMNVTLDVGNYNITKVLGLDGNAMDAYEQLYVDAYTCAETKVDLFTEILNDIEFSGCVNPACVVMCQSEIPAADFGNDLEGYIEALKACLDDKITNNPEVCALPQVADVNLCENLRMMMINDMRPNGQYGTVRDEQGNLEIANLPCTSIYAEDNIFGINYQNIDYGGLEVNISGDLTPVGQLSLEDFMIYEEDAWIEFMLPYHPEYGHLEWCEEGDPEGSNFDNVFLNADREEAILQGYFNPLGMDVSDVGYDVVPASSVVIPGAFPAIAIGSPEYNDLVAAMNVRFTFPGNASNNFQDIEYSIWDISYLIALSNVLDIRAILIHLVTEGFPPRGGWDEAFGEHLCNSERFWEIFKGIYIGLKKDKVNILKNDYIQNFYTNPPSNIPTLPACYPLGSEVFGSADTHCGCDNWEIIMQRVFDENNSNEFTNTVQELEDAQAAYDLAYDNVLANYTQPYTAEQLAEAEAAGLAAVSDLEGIGTTDSIEEQCDSICNSYRDQWRAELAGCELSEPEMELLLAELVAVCKEGCDVNHPLGARDTESGDSFEQVISTHVSSIDDTCNDLLLTVPPSYNTDVFAGSQPIFDDCVCDRYTQIYSEYENSTSGPTDFDGFYDYLELEYEVNFSSDEIIDLDCACRNQGMIDPDFLLATPFGTNQIPAPFSCIACLDCDQMNALVDRFFVEIDDNIIPENALTQDLILSSTFRPIFRNWLNQELGFNLSFEEYIDFINYCQNGVGGAMGMMGSNQVVPSIPQQFNRAFVQRSVIAGKTKGINTLTSTNANLDFTISTIQPTTTAGDQVEYNIIITNTGNQAIVFDYLGVLPGGWSFTNAPTELFGGNIIIQSPINPSQLKISGMTLPAGEEVDWSLTVQVPSDIYLAKKYYHQGSLSEESGDVTYSDDPATTEAADPTGIFLEVPDPCQGNVETEEDMVLFLNELITAVGNNPSYPVIIPFNNLTSLSNNSSLNLWTDRAIENLSVQIPDPALTGNELTILFTNDCFGVEILCAVTLDGITSLSEINEVTGAMALTTSAAGEYILQIDIIDDQNIARSILAASGCFDLTPCEKRQLCNRSVTFPGEPVDDCLDYVLDLAALQANTEYEDLIDDSRERFRYEYALQCMSTGDILTQEFTTREYHHTLYYYDQSGNLIRTIPPKGVAYLSTSNISANGINELQNVKDFRDDVPDAMAVYPAHGMRTTYEYNTFNQVWRQNSIDAPTRTIFFYDNLGRIVVSQDGRQFGYGANGRRYSYSLYDELGRITETGEIIRNQVDGQNAPNMTYGIARDPDLLQNWLNWAGNTRVDVVRNIYDSNLSSSTIDIDTYFDQPRRYLRKRISSSLYYDVYTPGNNGNYSHGTHYDYDIHGNVKTLIQEFPSLKNIGEDLKRIDYSYDLISGNVNQVNYQEGDADAFYHRYEYDADNRITSVETSKDQLIWDEDATYQYYDHGPLARTEIGENKVQGCDYTYTIHGWIKGVNSNTLVETRDPGKDGAVGQIHSLLAADAYGYSLGYYSGDYEAIANLSTNNNFLATESSDVQALDLFNGNIRSMVTAITKPDGTTVDNLPSVYQYDQLHRIKNMQKYTSIDAATNSWGASQPMDAYQTSYQYDPNGNLKRLTRRDDNNMIDDLTYGYEGETATLLGTNRLDKVDDAVTAVTVGDFKDQGNNNYGYDRSGNLIRDISNRINRIEWNVQGKVKSISHYANTNLEDLPNMVFRYDPAGNRIVKITKKGTNPEDINYTYYVRDASGNVMSVYNGKNPIVDNQEEMTELYQKESHLYGSSRLGIKQSDIAGINLSGYDRPIGLTQRTAGQRFYELSNHLGNVLTTVSDNKLLAYQGNALPLYKAEVISYNDYYPFGWEMPGRQGSTGAYRYGFNGKEKDSDGEFGAITHYDYGFRIYNPGIGKFLSVDPLTGIYPMLTPYQFASNRPIDGIDLDGLEWKISTKDIYSTDPKTKKINSSKVIRQVEINITIDAYNNTPNTYHMLNYVDAIAVDLQNSYESVSGEKVKRQRTFSEWWAGVPDKEVIVEYEVTVNVDIQEIEDLKHKRSNSMLLEVLPDKTSPQLGKKGTSYGRGPFYGNQVYLNEKYLIDQIYSTDNNTIPHEFGHTAGLRHPDTECNGGMFCSDSQWIDPLIEPNNIMYSGSSGLLNDKTSTKTTIDQLEIMIKNYEDGKLNKNTIGN